MDRERNGLLLWLINMCSVNANGLRSLKHRTNTPPFRANPETTADTTQSNLPKPLPIVADGASLGIDQCVVEDELGGGLGGVAGHPPLAFATATRPTAVRRYFWRRLFGLSRMVSSTRPRSRKTATTLFSCPATEDRPSLVASSKFDHSPARSASRFTRRMPGPSGLGRRRPSPIFSAKTDSYPP